MDLRTPLGGLPYAIVGGIATREYMPERFTKDVDVLVAPEALDAAQARLTDSGWQRGQQLTFPQSSLGLHGVTLSFAHEELDLISGTGPWVHEALERVRENDSHMRIIALAYLVLMKLDAGRTQDTSDISRMLALASAEQLEQTRSVVRRFAPDPSSLEDLESLIEIGRWELER